MTFFRLFWSCLLVIFGCHALQAQVYEAHPLGIRLQYGVINYNEGDLTSIADQYRIPLAAGLTFSIYPGGNAVFETGLKHYSSPLDNDRNLCVWSGQVLFKVVPKKVKPGYRLNRFQPYLGLGGGYEFLRTRGGPDSIPRTSFHQFFIPVEAGIDFNLSPRWTIGVFGEYRLSPFQEKRNKINDYDRWTAMVNTAGITLGYHFGQKRIRFDAPPVYLGQSRIPTDSTDQAVEVMDIPSPTIEEKKVEIVVRPDTVTLVVKVLTESGLTPDTVVVKAPASPMPIDIDGSYTADSADIAPAIDTLAYPDTLAAFQTPDTITVPVADTILEPAAVELDTLVEDSLPLEGRLFGIRLPEGYKGLTSATNPALRAYADSLKSASRQALGRQITRTDTLVVLKEQPRITLPTTHTVIERRTDTLVVRDTLIKTPEPARLTPAAISSREQQLMSERDSLARLLYEYKLRSTPFLPPVEQFPAERTYQESQVLLQQMQSNRIQELEMYIRKLELQVAELGGRVADVERQDTAAARTYLPETITDTVRLPAIPDTVIIRDTITIRDTMTLEPVIQVPQDVMSAEDVAKVVKANVDSALQIVFQQLEQLSDKLASQPAEPEVSLPAPLKPRTQITVYFAVNSSTVSQADRALITQAILARPWGEVEHVTLSGHTDPSGSAAYNLALSQRRVAAVKAILLQLGVPATQISEQIFGDAKAGNAPPAAERRVELIFSIK